MHARRAMFLALGCTVMCLAPVCLTACDLGRKGAPVPEIGAGSTWRWRATGMKVTALTTPFPATADEDASLDVRIAFYDTDDDQTKAIGMLTLVVTTAGRELARSEVPLNDPRHHHEHWDSVTQTYSVRLPLAGGAKPQPGQTLEVRSVFEGEDGSLMRANRDVKWPRNDRPQPPDAAGTGTPSAAPSASPTTAPAVGSASAPSTTSSATSAAELVR